MEKHISDIVFYISIFLILDLYMNYDKVGKSFYIYSGTEKRQSNLFKLLSLI